MVDALFSAVYLLLLLLLCRCIFIVSRAAGRAAIPGQLVRYGACSIRCSLK